MSNLSDRIVKLMKDHRNSVTAMARFVMHVKPYLQKRAKDNREGLALIPPASLPLVLAVDGSNLAQESPDEVVAQLNNIQALMDTLFERDQELLYRMAFVNRLALFDALIPDLLIALFIEQPEMLKSKEKKLTYKEVIDRSSGGSLYEYMARTLILETSRQSIKTQASFIFDNLEIELCSETNLNSLTEISARRNLFAHANGYVNEIYKSQVANSPFAIGEQLGVDFEYWYDSNKLLLDVAIAFVDKVFLKYCPETPLPVFLSFVY